MQETAAALKRGGKRIGLVPTMGFLHDGHLSLVEEAKRHADVLVVSIFVNPAQFGPDEDLDAYPRDAQKDERLCRDEDVDLLFFPDAAGMYPSGFETTVSQANLPRGLCGRFRPVHFSGVATVVTKLFNIVQPDVAVFGEKDYQQLIIIRRLVADLNFPVRIIGGATIREPDGLAMSSRNAYLSGNQRTAALSLSRALVHAQASVAAGATDARDICREAETSISAHDDTTIDYVAIVDPNTLQPVESLVGETRMVIAVRVGKTRLIDNMALVAAT